MEIRQNNFHNYCTQYSFVTKKVHHSYLKNNFFCIFEYKIKIEQFVKYYCIIDRLPNTFK